MEGAGDRGALRMAATEAINTVRAAAVDRAVERAKAGAGAGRGRIRTAEARRGEGVFARPIVQK